MANDTAVADSSFNDDRRRSGDAQAQAALLLVESLMHSLLDNGALTKTQALQAIDSAYAVKEESVSENKERVGTLHQSLAILAAMRNSISAHEGRYDPSPEAGPQRGRADGQIA